MKLNVAYLALGLTLAGHLASAVPLPIEEPIASRGLEGGGPKNERVRVFHPTGSFELHEERSADNDGDIAEYARDLIDSRGWLPAIKGGAKLIAAGVGSGMVAGAIDKASNWLAQRIRGRDVHEALARGDHYYAERGDRGAFILPGKRDGEAMFVPTKRGDVADDPDVVPNKRDAGQVFFVPAKRGTVDIPVVIGRRDNGGGGISGGGGTRDKRKVVDIPVVIGRQDDGGTVDKRRVIDIPVIATRQSGSIGGPGKREAVDIPIVSNRRDGNELPGPFDKAILIKRGTAEIPVLTTRGEAVPAPAETPPDSKNHPEDVAPEADETHQEEARHFSLGKVLKILIRDGGDSLNTRAIDPSQFRFRTSFIPVSARGDALERDNLSDEPLRGGRRLDIRGLNQERDTILDEPLRGTRRLDFRDFDDLQARGLLMTRESQGGALSGSLGGRGGGANYDYSDAVRARGILRGLVRMVFDRRDDDGDGDGGDAAIHAARDFDGGDLAARLYDDGE